METKIMLTGVAILLAIVIVLTVLYKKNKENFRQCVCSQTMDRRACQDTDIVQDLYVNSDLTEFTNLKSQGWGQVSPGDIAYPTSKGCPWPDIEDSKGWASWDFTDFGG